MKRPKTCQTCAARAKSAFKDLNASECAKLDRVRRPTHFAAASKISFDKELGFYCLAKGHWEVSVKSSAKENALRIAGPGDVIGFGNCLEPSHKHSATTIEESEACFFSKDVYETELTSNPVIMGALAKALCRIIFIKDQRILGLMNTSVKSRVAAVLLSLHEKFGLRAADGVKIDVPISRKTLAALAGTVPETLARMLTELEQDKIVRRKKRALYILNLDKLKGL